MNFRLDDIEQAIKSYPWGNIESYSSWLSQIYYIVSHSTPLLALACGRSIHNRPFHFRCIEHLSEEKGHDQLILNDLKGMSRKPEPELASTMLVYRTQYYQVEHLNPVAFLGYVMFLELLATHFGNFVYSEVVKHSPRSVAFLKIHNNDDIDHVKSAMDVLEQLSENERIQVIENFEMTKRAYILMLSEASKSMIQAA